MAYENNYGVEKQTELNYYSSDMYEGERITISYNEETNEIQHETGAIYLIRK